MAYGREHTMSTFNSLNLNACATVDRRPSHELSRNKESEPKRLSSSRADDPFPGIDDGDSETKEIICINLEDDAESSTKEHHAVPVRQAVVANNHTLGFKSVAKSRSPVNNVRQFNSATYTEKNFFPLFRTLTKDEIPAQGVQTVRKNRGIGFQAWYNTHETDNASSAAPAMLRNDISQTPSITLLNRERTKNLARSDRDEPQFAMSVLNSKRKRTMGELSYNELIPPSQIESPSEKLARIAKKRRQRQEMSGTWPHSTSTGNVHHANDLEYVNRYGNDRSTGENVEPAESPIEHEQLDRCESVARVGDERRGPPIVREVSPINIVPLNEGQKDHLAIQYQENLRDDHANPSDIGSEQPTGLICDTREHGGGTNVAPLTRSHKAKNAKPRVSGPTNVCGVYSPEKKRPVKRSNRGDFHCPRCDSQFTTLNSVNYHFENCIAKYGNPRSLKWNDHPSLERAGERVFSRNRNEQTTIVPAPVPAVKDDPINRMRDTEPVRKDESTTNIVDLSPASNIQASGLSIITEKPPITDEQVSFAGTELKSDNQTSLVEHRTTGGKGLSAETLKTFQETGSWDLALTVDQSVDGFQDEETEVPDIAYRYFVQKREWLETEEDAIESNMGPYYTLNEANAVAKAEVQCPQTDEFEGIPSQGWSYYYRQDEHGMQMHMATVLEINIEAAVHREVAELAPANKQVSIPKSAFVVAPRVYIVHELQWLPAPDDTASTAPTHCQSLTHGVFILLKRANQRAAEEYLESLTGNWGASEYDQLRKMEAKSNLDKKVRDLNRDDGCFCEEIKLGSEGFAKVWVELAVVEGPRN